ncbi:mechanosensitive ion channel family protein [Natrononativus amylolyticus]|uniref:mechanosensitive ion channel family protein n=1 Tax=Natrononativus amylolyticus TaxID=2963434 RepID=UPI0020CBA02D|nr:mechanosensitive ion channel family protein [Natrononativus amylolyticus]
MPVTARLEELLVEYAAILESLTVLVVTFVLVYLAGRYLLEPLAQWVMDVRGTDPTLRRGLQQAVAIGVVVLAALIALSVAEFDYLLQRSAIIVAALTVALGFAAQNVVGNVVSGAFIVTDPKYNIGDWIRWDDQEGIIEDISFRTTRVRTFDNEVVMVPNSTLTTTAVTNAVLNDHIRLEVPVEIDYDDDLETAVRVLADVAAAHPDILEEPEPQVFVTDLEGAIRLSARFWIADPSRQSFAKIRSAYARRVLERFDERGIDLGAPATQELRGGLEVIPRTEDGPVR